MRLLPSILALTFPLLLTCGLGGCTHAARPTNAPSVSPSASTTPPAKPAPTAPAAPVEPTYAVRFERTPCMGKCPTFVLEVEPDGKAHYVGGAFSPLEGEKELEVARDFFPTVGQLAKQMKFAEMPEDEYGHGMMDAPSAIVTLRQETGELKTVKCTGMECPPELLALHKYLDRQVRTALGVEEE